MIVTPLFDRVLVVPVDDEEKTTRGGLAIPDMARGNRKWLYGEVVGIGDGRKDMMGNLVKPTVKVGDVVMYLRSSADVAVTITIIDDKTMEAHEVVHHVLTEPMILARVRGLQRETAIVDAAGKKLLAMTPFSIAKPDIGYANDEATEIARRGGFLDKNPDGTDDHINETE